MDLYSLVSLAVYSKLKICRKLFQHHCYSGNRLKYMVVSVSKQNVFCYIFGANIITKLFQWIHTFNKLVETHPCITTLKAHINNKPFDLQ